MGLGVKSNGSVRSFLLFTTLTTSRLVFNVSLSPIVVVKPLAMVAKIAMVFILQ
jgi:hypothetical protein